MLKQNRLILRLFIIWMSILCAVLSLLICSYGLYDLDTIIFGSVIALLPLYFLPNIVAIKKFHPSTLAITVLNLFTGGFFFGWVAALVWALSNPNKTIILYKNEMKQLPAWFDDYNENAPHKALKMMTPRQFIKKVLRG